MLVRDKEGLKRELAAWYNISRRFCLKTLVEQGKRTIHIRDGIFSVWNVAREYLVGYEMAYQSY